MRSFFEGEENRLSSRALGNSLADFSGGSEVPSFWSPRRIKSQPLTHLGEPRASPLKSRDFLGAGIEADRDATSGGNAGRYSGCIRMARHRSF